MFFKHGINGVNLNNFYTNNVKNMASMFKYCKSVVFLDVSNFNADNVKNMSQIFLDVKN